MKKIRIIYDQTAYTYRWLSALQLAKKEFKEKGYKIIFPAFFKGLFSGSSISKYLKGYKKHVDIIMVAIHPDNCMFKGESPTIFKLLKKLRNCCDKLVWLDTSDSSGTTFFEAFKYVDYYLKKQLYKDLEMYSNDYMLDRYYCDYYYKRYANFSAEPLLHKNTPLPADKKTRVGLSWNIGIGMPFEKNKIRFILNLNRVFDKKFKIKRHESKYDIYFNGSLRSGLIGFQRQLAVNSIEKSSLTHAELRKKVNTKEYYRQLEQTRYLVSPFGWGEICIRDFEAFKYGCVLVKVSMDYMVTYPNFYIPFVTYVPCNLDFSNLEEMIKKSDSINATASILANVDNLFSYFFSTEGKREFVNHILNNIGE